MKETEVKGQKVWQIKAVPKTKDEAKKSGYSKSVVFIRQDNYVMIRGVRWVHKKKRIKYLDVRKLEKIDEIMGFNRNACDHKIWQKNFA